MLPGPLAWAPEGWWGGCPTHGGSSQGGEELELQPFPRPMPAQRTLAAVSCRCLGGRPATAARGRQQAGPSGLQVSLVQASLTLTGCLSFQSGTGEGQREKKCLIRALKV